MQSPFMFEHLHQKQNAEIAIKTNDPLKVPQDRFIKKKVRP